MKLIMTTEVASILHDSYNNPRGTMVTTPNMAF